MWPNLASLSPPPKELGLGWGLTVKTSSESSWVLGHVGEPHPGEPTGGGGAQLCPGRC